MAEIYIGRWEWFTHPIGGDSYWRPPGGDNIGAYDLRSNVDCGTPGPMPQGVGLFVYATPKTHSNLLISLGSDLTRNLRLVEKSGIRTLLNLPLGTFVADKLGEAIEQLGFDFAYYDPTGQSRVKPLCGRRGKPLEFLISSLGQLAGQRISRTFDATHPAFQATIDVFKADYIHNREVSLIDPLILRKWTGDMLLKLTGRLSALDADALLPAKYRSDGFEQPTTLITDTFTDTVATSLDAHTSDTGGTWVEIVSDWSISATNEASTDGVGVGMARQTTALSGNDQNSKIAISAYGVNGQNGAFARMTSDASPNHDGYSAYTLAASLIGFFKTVDGTNTALDTNQSITESAPDDVECEVNGSTMISRFNGSTLHNFSDSSLTAGLFAGMRQRRIGDLITRFDAQDLVVGGASNVVPLLMRQRRLRAA